MKTRKLFFIIAGIALIKTVKSQDLVVTNDSIRIKTVILEIQANSVKYNLFKNSGGPCYIMSRANIAYIKYSNGTTERFTETKQRELGKYNLDGSQSSEMKNYYRVPGSSRNYDHLYKRRGYLGFNHLGLINSNISLSYMLDCKKEHFILHIPFAIGIGKPEITNAMYSGNANGARNTYNTMNYQIGAGILFSPSFEHPVNFLIGPSFSFAQYDVSTENIQTIYNGIGSYTNIRFTNDFVLFRQQYGGSIGFLFRMSERINMSIIAGLGFKKDTYNEEDPYGIEYMNAQLGYRGYAKTSVAPYANLAWTIGYRF